MRNNAPSYIFLMAHPLSDQPISHTHFQNLQSGFLNDFLNYEALVQDESSTTSLPPPESPNAGDTNPSLATCLSNKKKNALTGLTEPRWDNSIVLDGEFLPISLTGGAKIVSRVVVRDHKFDLIFQATIRPPTSMIEGGLVKERYESRECAPDLSLSQVQTFLLSHFSDKIVVGYDVVTLLKTLKCRHPWQNCRELRKYHPFMTKCDLLDKKIPRSLKSLVEEYMGFTFDELADCPEHRASMALCLYYKVKKSWDNSIAVGYSKFLERASTTIAPPIPPRRPIMGSAYTAPPSLHSSVNEAMAPTISDDPWDPVNSSGTAETIWCSKLYSLPIHTPQRHFRSSQDEATKQTVKEYVDRLSCCIEKENKITFTDPERELMSNFARLEREMVEALAIGDEEVDLQGLSLSEIDRVFYAQQSPRDDEDNLKSTNSEEKEDGTNTFETPNHFALEFDCNSTLESRTWVVTEFSDEDSDNSSTRTYFLQFNDP